MNRQDDLLFDAPAFAVTKSYRDENGQMFIEGIASTVDIDLTDERMSPEAIAIMAARLPGKPLREEHQKGYLNILGQIVQADVIKDDNGNPALWIKAKLHDWSSAAKDTFEAIKSGVKLGLSVAGNIKPGGLVRELVESKGKYIPTYKDIDPFEVSVTDHPANLGTFAVAVAKSMNQALEKDVTNTHDTKPKEYADVPTSDFLDPDNYKYPVDEKHLMPALRYFNQDGQRADGGYSDDQWAEMGRKLADKLSNATNDKYTYDASSEKVSKEDTQKAKEVSDMNKQKSGLVSTKINDEVKEFGKAWGKDIKTEVEKASTSTDDSSTDTSSTPSMEVVGDTKTPTTTATDTKTTDTGTTDTKTAKKDLTMEVSDSSSTDSSDGSTSTDTGSVESLLSEIMSTLTSLQSSTGTSSTDTTDTDSSTDSTSDGSTSTDGTTTLEDCLSSLAQVMENLKTMKSGSMSASTTTPTKTSTQTTSTPTTASTTPTTGTTETTSTSKALKEIVVALKQLADHQQALQKSIDDQPRARKGVAVVVEKQFEGGNAENTDLYETLKSDPKVTFREQLAYKEFGIVPKAYANKQ